MTTFSYKKCGSDYEKCIKVTKVWMTFSVLHVEVVDKKVLKPVLVNTGLISSVGRQCSTFKGNNEAFA